ncbi:Sucrose symporter plant [Penicillium cataractarum]|uniref:Sucrose symporter plant n=1 Tax=Penicillium cataractarum TaxID=2100454 RepID=A0A9W9RZP5_9EURO|nr:Sucrose symporter plant [Penicillium cataractarum]KAJ5369331.1 Sucrose symporter plant [Penicillium cataractarum]
MSVKKDEPPKVEVNIINHEEAANFYPIGPKLILITISLMLAVFCVALDNTIIAVAIPRISDDFHALNDVGWYASSYLLTTCSFQLLYGKFYTLFQVKWVYLMALFIFELGSLICGVAPNSTTLIIGRAIAGLGSAGMWTGALVTLAHTVELEKRPVFFSTLGGMYGLASVAGPLLGGAFTDHASWRWCFYINLPLGGITAFGLLTLLKLPPKEKTQKTPMDIFLELDPIGTVIFVPAIVCLLLALQWGGVTYDWASGRIIALFLVFGVAIVVFVALQVILKDRATVPTDIARQQTIAFASFFGICMGGSFFIMIYYIPIWFQAIHGASAVQSGIDSLPMMLSSVFGIIVAGGMTTHFGYNAPFFIASSIIMSIGAGLTTTFTIGTSQAKWVGFLFIYGLGGGLGFQQGGVAAQAVLPLSKVSIGTAIVLFLQLLGGSLFVAAAQNIFAKELIKNLEALNISGFSPFDVINGGATSIRAIVSESNLSNVLLAYNNALVEVFQLALILSCLSIIGALGIEWKSLKPKKANERAV